MKPVVRTMMVGVLAGVLGVATAWAGASFAPVGGTLGTSDVSVMTGGPLDRNPASARLGEAADLSTRLQGGSKHPAPDGDAPISGGEQLAGGWFRAGTAVRSLVPPDDRWVPGSQCGGAPEQLYTPLTPEGCLITFDMRWANGVDEDNPIQVRAIAIGNGQDAIVYAAMDLVGYMAAYPITSCRDCGLTPIRESLASELGIPAQNFVIASTHTHAAPTTIADGPVWYYEFVRDQVKDAIRAAVSDAAANPPVRLATGATFAKPFNTDRRIVNRAVPDYELGWLRAYVPGKGKSPDTTLVTLGNFAVHTTIRANNAQLHSGLVGPFAQHLEAELGGTGIFFPGGLGDQRVDRGFGIYGAGIGLAQAIVEDVRRGGHVLESNDIAVAHTTVSIPVENQFFTAALAAGYAVRDILPPFGGGPLTAVVQRGGANVPVCTGVGAVHVIGPVSAIRLGEQPPAGKRVLGDEYALPVLTDNVVLVHAPGEIFASIGLIVKDYLNRSSNVLVFGMANDTLGYMTPANQYDLSASQGGGLVHNAAGTGNYEEALSLGRCSGEIVMDAMLRAGQELGVMGEGERP